MEVEAAACPTWVAEASPVNQPINILIINTHFIRLRYNNNNNHNNDDNNNNYYYYYYCHNNSYI